MKELLFLTSTPFLGFTLSLLSAVLTLSFSQIIAYSFRILILLARHTMYAYDNQLYKTVDKIGVKYEKTHEL
jgi:hypothetical protein